MYKLNYDLFDVNRKEELISYINDIFDAFINSEALNEIFRILDTDINNLSDGYNARIRKNKTVIEPQLMSENRKLEKYRYELFPLFKELNLYNKNKTGLEDYTRIIVLAGTLDACNVRTGCAKKFVNSTTKRIDGLSCYRPINPIEREQTEYHCECDTEFGALSDAFVNCFGLGKTDYKDSFTTDRNINSITCIREFNDTYKGANVHIYACPSLQPDIRRADTGDCLLYYINNNTFDNSDKLLFMSQRRYCIRQFIQILFYMLKTEYMLPFDIVGNVSDDNLPTEDTYNLRYDLQELIAIIDWINRFRDEYIVTE